MTTQDKLNEIFCEVFDDGDLSISPEMTANDLDAFPFKPDHCHREPVQLSF